MQDSAISKEYQDKKGKPYTPGIKEKKLLGYIDEQQQSGTLNRGSVVEDTWMGMAFYTGQHWVRWNRAAQLLQPDSPPPWRVRMVLNYILPTVETFVAKVTENRPGWQCMPATPDDDDIEAARNCNSYLDWVYDDQSLDLKLHELVKTAACSPLAFMKVYWDPTWGEKEVVEVEPENEVPDEEGFMPRQYEKRSPGGIRFDVLSGLDCWWDPGCKDMETMRWMGQSNFMHIDEVRARWPKKGKHVQATSDVTATNDDMALQVIRHFRTSDGTADAGADRCEVVEYWERSSPRHKDGLHVVCIPGQVVLHEGPLPYDTIPFAVVRHNTVPGRLHGEGLVRPLIPAQKELNKCASQRIENKNLQAQPKYRAEAGSIKKAAISDEPGEIIFYKKTATRPPEPLPPTPLSQEHRMLEIDQRQNMENISGISDVSRGQAPASFSGRAIRHTAALDQTKLGPFVKEVERCLSRMASIGLRITRDNMGAERMIAIIGTMNEMSVKRFYRRDIKSTDVRIQPFSTTSKNIAVRQEMIMQMFQLGLYGPQQDPRVIMAARKDMEFGNLDVIQGDRTRERNYAEEEMHDMANGIFRDVEPYEDHITHIDVHMEYMRGTEYRLLSDEDKQMFKMHLAWHYYQQGQMQQGAPWWAPYVQSGEQGWPPAATQGQPPQGQTPPAPQMDAFGPQPGDEPGIAPGMGGTPELNNAVGPMGPGVGPMDAMN